jgi:chromosomal replication initiator protein
MASESINKSAKEIWNDCLAIIKDNVNPQKFKTWFEPIVAVELNGNRLTIQVPSQFYYEWLEEHYNTLLKKTISKVIGPNTQLKYLIAVVEDSNTQTFVTISSSKQAISPIATQPHPNKAEPTGYKVESHLNPRYTFDNFIKGDSNQLARAAALAAANNPGKTSFNPLVIYGGVGLGKTHLIQAIGHQALIHLPNAKIVYVSSDKFTVDFVDSIERGKVNEFSNFYRGVDVLMLDDIQFFGGKEKTQETFFHIFNVLHQLGKQIVLSCDRPPKEIKGVEERLISRFHWGLTADIQPPDLETRIAILKKKSTDDGIQLFDDVIEFIASNVTSNIRELEGCLISLLAKSSLENREINIDLAREAIKIVVGEPKTKVTIEEIQRIVSEYYGIAEDLIRAKTRKQEVVNARQVAMHIAKGLTQQSLKTIGLHFGGRDHSTVIHACQTIEEQMKQDDKFRSQVEQIKRKIEMTTR